MEPTPGPERVSRRLREQFAPAYLAITGLVQVLVLDALITKVEGGYTDYGATEWLLVAANFSSARTCAAGCSATGWWR